MSRLGVKNQATKAKGIQTQQRYSSCRAIPVAIALRSCFMLAFEGVSGGSCAICRRIGGCHTDKSVKVKVPMSSSLTRYDATWGTAARWHRNIIVCWLAHFCVPLALTLNRFHTHGKKLKVLGACVSAPQTERTWKRHPFFRVPRWRPFKPFPNNLWTYHGQTPSTAKLLK